MRVSIFSTISVWNISYSKKNWARYDTKCILVLIVMYPLFLSHFNENSIFSTDLRQILKNISWKSAQWESSSSMRAVGRTDWYEGNSRFSQLYQGTLSYIHHTLCQKLSPV